MVVFIEAERGEVMIRRNLLAGKREPMGLGPENTLSVFRRGRHPFKFLIANAWVMTLYSDPCAFAVLFTV